MNKLIQVVMLFVLLQGYKLQAFEAEPTTITTADIVGAITLDRSCLNGPTPLPMRVAMWLLCSKAFWSKMWKNLCSKTFQMR